jgi:hypothetical protein
MSTLESAIRTVLEEFWEEQSISVDGESTSVDDLVAAMDSFTATEVLERAEEIVGMDLPSGKVIRQGGYDSKDQFVDQLTSRILDYVGENS